MVTIALDSVGVTLMLDRASLTNVVNASLVPMSMMADTGIESLENADIGTWPRLAYVTTLDSLGHVREDTTALESETTLAEVVVANDTIELESDDTTLDSPLKLARVA